MRCPLSTLQAARTFAPLVGDLVTDCFGNVNTCLASSLLDANKASSKATHRTRGPVVKIKAQERGTLYRPRRMGVLTGDTQRMVSPATSTPDLEIMRDVEKHCGEG